MCKNRERRMKKTKIDTIESIAAVEMGCPPSCGEDSPSLTRPYLCPIEGWTEEYLHSNPLWGRNAGLATGFKGGWRFIIYAYNISSEFYFSAFTI